MVSIRALARQTSVPRETLRCQLLELHRKCQEGSCGAERTGSPEHKLWLFRPTRGSWCVNISRLRVEHPERFPGPNLAEVTERLDATEAALKDMRKRINALGAAFREHKQDHDKEKDHGER